ncbi:hypothetical protein PVAP13_7KG352941 [Panicum virgatum]|uniref:Uncharacterized protein n=1 Tax=Panicum virgatum TaxID=38727 RepID=A0A8T0QIJ2_PANVG|nr:hypothetical protein PVAP13_7KG352941 [Panicum virgatum]
MQRDGRSWSQMVLDAIAEDEKEAAAAVELSSYALLRTRATRRNLSHTATEVGKPSVRGERSWPSSPSRPAQKLREDSKQIR